MNDNDPPTSDFTLKKVEILSGYDQASPDITRWYVNHHYADGSECIVDDSLSHRDAWESALESAAEDGACLPILDNSSVR